MRPCVDRARKIMKDHPMRDWRRVAQQTIPAGICTRPECDGLSCRSYVVGYVTDQAWAVVMAGAAAADAKPGKGRRP